MLKRPTKRILFSVSWLIMSHLAAQSQLPPQPDWKGKSESWMLPAKHPAATAFERSGGKQGAEYKACMSYIDSLSARHPELRYRAIGKTAGQRDLHLVAVGENPDLLLQGQRRPDRPLLLFQAGIHSGEIDGLDAGLMFIREMLSGRLRSLQKQVDFLLVPALNRDGLDRLSAFSRINQNGPEKQGWRSNALNQNLNRDYMKLDSPELKALIPLIHRLNPELYIDIHVTDGADYQYDITYGGMTAGAHSARVSRWLNEDLRSFVDGALRQNGHIPGPLVFLKNELKPDSGLVQYAFSPRFSHAYADVCGIPALLIENHSLKPFRQRVCGTLVLMEALCRKVVEDFRKLDSLRRLDRENAASTVPLEWSFPRHATDSLDFRAVEYDLKSSPLAGTQYPAWNAKPYTVKIPVLQQDSLVKSLSMPSAFYVPAARIDVIERLKKHGIELEVLPNDTSIRLRTFRFAQIQAAKSAFQGRFRMSGNASVTEEWHRLHAGSVKVSTRQPLGRLACLLLHPDSPDSFFQWGFFADITERTEYFETYAMAPLAEALAKEHPEWLKSFEEKCAADEAFRNNPDARLRWWYERSAYHDAYFMRYPIGMQ